MTNRQTGRRWHLTLGAIGSLILILLQSACVPGQASRREASGTSDMGMLQPEVAATLTAWPTPPPLITRPPAATVAPQPLWTGPTLTGTGQPAQAAMAETPVYSGSAPAVGSKPPAVQLLIPRLALDIPVVEVSWVVVDSGGELASVWQTADHAAGHHRNSANPGELGNVVISGHQNTRGEVLRQVSEIGQPGSAFSVGDDIILIAQDGQRYTYTVSSWDRFAEEGASPVEQRQHASYMAPTSDATLTLITCWPYTGNTHRVVVVAKLKQ